MGDVVLSGHARLGTSISKYGRKGRARLAVVGRAEMRRLDCSRNDCAFGRYGMTGGCRRCSLLCPG